MAHLATRTILALAILSPAACSDDTLVNIGDADLTTNVLLVVVDTLRADHIGAYGGRVRTPNMDGLARSGVRFERAYSHIPFTGPSHASLFTSLLPRAHGVRNNIQPLADEHVTLAELLRATDRRTAGFVSLGVVRTPSGLSQGFDEYQDDFALDGWKTAGELNHRLVSWLEHAEDSFFVWAHYSDPHEPYSPPNRSYPRIAVRQDGREEIEISANASSVSIPLVVPPGNSVIQVSSVPGTDPRPIRIQDIRVTDAHVDATCARGCDGAGESSGGRGIVAAIELINRNTSDTNVALRFRADELLSLSEVRRSPCHARGADQLHAHIELLRCYYNFIRPHSALRFGRETRTPAMQAGLVSERLALGDIFTACGLTLRVLIAIVLHAVAGQPTESDAVELPTRCSLSARQKAA